jgi:hypothetical protein
VAARTNGVSVNRAQTPCYGAAARGASLAAQDDWSVHQIGCLAELRGSGCALPDPCKEAQQVSIAIKRREFTGAVVGFSTTVDGLVQDLTGSQFGVETVDILHGDAAARGAGDKRLGA